MHTAETLKTAEYAIEINGSPAGFDDLFEGFELDDRFGFVLRTPGAGIAIGGLITGVVTRWYDFLRARGEPFWAYPDFYVLHVGALHGLHAHLDIWPEHKEVVIETVESEPILAAINDRAITRLVVEDGPRLPRAYLGETLTPALARIRTALAFGGEDADVVVSCPPEAEKMVRGTAEVSRAIDADAIDRRLAEREGGERLRRISVPDALAMLAGGAEREPGYGFSTAYTSAYGLAREDLTSATIHEP
jgi:hypothetical protein